jgi:periplasmic divalent cation tolerance protein
MMLVCRALHPYDVPCIIAPPIIAGNHAYMDWVLAETRQPRTSP